MVLQQLQTRVDELEKLLAARSLRPAAPSGGIRMSRDVLEFDADALLRMVDNLEHNMKQSMAESDRGRLYDRYMEKRDARLRERWGSQRHRMRMEESFGETRAQMNEQFGRLDQINQKPPAVVQSIEHREQDGVNFYQSEVSGSERVKYGNGTFLDNAAPNHGSDNISEKLLHRRSSSFTTPPTIARPSTTTRLTNSGSTKQREKSQTSSSQSGQFSSGLRKENLKPVTGISKVNDPLSPRSFLRSKSSAEGPKDLKEEKVPRPQHRRIQSFGSSTSMNSDNPSTALSRFSKEKSEKSVPRKSLDNAQSKPFLRRGSGIGPGAGASIAKMRAINAFEIQNNEEFGECRNRQSYSESEGEESITSDSVKFKNDVILSSDTQVDNHSSYAASQFRTTTDNMEGSMWNHTHPLCVMREANAARVRKKWASPEKIVLATDASDKPLKDVAKAFKKLLKFGKKSKNAESVGDSMSTSTASEGFDDMDDHHDSMNQPSDDLKKLRMSYLVSPLVGSY